DITALLTRLHRRLRRLLIRRGQWPAHDAGSDPFAAQEPLFAGVVAASLQGRVALGPRAGQPVRRPRSAATATATGARVARFEGFSLHADVAAPARRRNQLEKLCRYIVRPPLLLAYHGVLAPHAGWRPAIVRAAPSDAQPAGREAPRSPGRLPW